MVVTGPAIFIAEGWRANLFNQIRDETGIWHRRGNHRCNIRHVGFICRSCGRRRRRDRWLEIHISFFNHNCLTQYTIPHSRSHLARDRNYQSPYRHAKATTAPAIEIPDGAAKVE